jgi:alanine racemase
VAVEGIRRPAWAEIDLSALRHNARVLTEAIGDAALCAVVKADGYGHGALSAATAFLEGGADWLAVAIVDEGLELRAAGIDAPILLLSEPPADSMDAALEASLTPTLSTVAGVTAAAEAATRHHDVLGVHVKVDTGMHRMGVDPAALDELLDALEAAPVLELEGLWTHLAVADEDAVDAEAFTSLQLERFDAALAQVHARGLDPAFCHVANSAATLRVTDARRQMVRCGIALYGELPTSAVHAAGVELGLRPAMTIKAHVTAVRALEAGARPSYGRRRALPEAASVATVPIGYADGFPRALFASGAEVLIRGQRFPLAGQVTMDQIVVDVDSVPVEVGDEVVLLGAQGAERITATEWADRLGTISYEVLCGIGPRVPRRAVG